MGRLAGVKPIMPKSRNTKIKDLRHLALLARPRCASAGCPWVVLGPFGPSCKRLGDGLGVWGLFEAILGRLGWQLGPSWGCLARLGCILGVSSSEASRKLIGPSVLRAAWGWVEGI